MVRFNQNNLGIMIQNKVKENWFEQFIVDEKLGKFIVKIIYKYLKFIFIKQVLRI